MKPEDVKVGSKVLVQLKMASIVGIIESIDEEAPGRSVVTVKSVPCENTYRALLDDVLMLFSDMKYESVEQPQRTKQKQESMWQTTKVKTVVLDDVPTPKPRKERKKKSVVDEVPDGNIIGAVVKAKTKQKESVSFDDFT